MSKINIKTRIIGKSGNLLILSNDWDASLDNPLSQGFIVEVDTGVHLTETYPLDYLFRINGYPSIYIHNTKLLIHKSR